MSVHGAAREALLTIVRERFRPVAGGASSRVGIEVEVIPVRATGGARVPPGDDAAGAGTLSVLRALAAARGWLERDTGYGVPAFTLPGGALVSYEPGGQIEYSSAVHPSPAALDHAVREAIDQLAAAMDREGIHLRARALDTATPAHRATMVLDGDRYRRQRAHYDRKGDAGRAMMLRTAGIHINVDFGAEPRVAWDAANAIAPHLVAWFANSPGHPDARSGVAPSDSVDASPHRSRRAAIWRALDASRTGIQSPVEDPAESYLDFALGAESFLLGEPGAPARPFADWRAAGATDDDFHRHLSTLFPEVRPRGYLELRSVDTLPARWCVVPVALASAALHDGAARDAILRELPPPSLARLERAGRSGLADAGLRDESRWLLPRLVEALASTARDAGARAVLRRVEEFIDRFSVRGRDPGHDPVARAEA